MLDLSNMSMNASIIHHLEQVLSVITFLSARHSVNSLNETTLLTEIREMEKKIYLMCANVLRKQDDECA